MKEQEVKNPLVNAPLHAIDWTILSSAIKWYKTAGFEYVEVPWAAPSSVVDITLPATRLAYGVIENGRQFENYLVGSAEQSLLHLALGGKLDFGRENEPKSYVATSPCFRDDTLDHFHQKQFMKVELFEPYYAKTPDLFLATRLSLMISKARTFFSNYISPNKLEIIPTNEGMDIQGNGVELGSYGVRKHRLPGTDLNVLSWVYGTGVAEPRLSQVRGM